MPRRRREIDPNVEYSAEELKRLKRNEYRRNWYARLSDERKFALKERMREYARGRCMHAGGVGLAVNDVGGGSMDTTQPTVVRSDILASSLEMGCSNVDRGGVMQDGRVEPDMLVDSMEIGSSSVDLGRIVQDDRVQPNMVEQAHVELNNEHVAIGVRSSSVDQHGGIKRRMVELDADNSHDESRRLRHNESQRTWYAGLPEERRQMMRNRMREYRERGRHEATIEAASNINNDGSTSGVISVAANSNAGHCGERAPVPMLHWQQQIARMHGWRQSREVRFTWNRVCIYCHTRLLENESDIFCCNKGKRILPRLPELHPVLARIYNERDFSKHSRKMNHLFCFTALGADGQFIELDAPSSVALMGRTYHQLLPVSRPHQPLHWYVHDSADRYPRAERYQLPFHWVTMVSSVLQAINRYCGLIKIMQDMHADTAMLRLNGTVVADEVAAVIHANDTVTVNPRIAVFWLHQNSQQVYISILDPQYEPLQYPLLFPNGTLGWSPYNEENMTQIEWYRCRLLHEERFLQLGRLTCEYLVDMYSRVEEERLNFLRTNGYSRRTTNSDEDFAEDEQLGRKVTLPSSFLGSSRWSSSQIADALALARTKGPPSLFVTMTTNPEWPEIKAMLRPGQNASEIPTVVVRAFHARLQYAKSLLRSLFGPIIYMVHVIEFQKRGLPHAHIVLKTEHDIPLEMVDSLISAEIPLDEELAEKVRKYMVHHHTDRCLKKGVCCWKYPRPINYSTHVDSNGYMQYRRRTENDRWVVSYSPFLVSQLDCHVNVDVAATVQIFTYLYAYIYKGFDRVQYRVDTNQSNRNEIDDYVNARYLSSTEAAWRIFNFHVTEKSPAVKCLPVHPRERTSVSCRRPATASLLDRYFLRPDSPEFLGLNYIEYYERYTLVPLKGMREVLNDHLELSQPPVPRNIVRRRTRNDIVCRIRLVMPHEGEVFYLRQLLLHTSPRTWEDLKMYNGQVYDTYQETLTAMGLLQNGTEHILTMEEAVSSLQTPSQLRFLFTLLILDGAPALELWNRYHFELIHDFYLNEQSNMMFADQRALISIENVLKQHGMTVTDFGLPSITIDSQLVLHELRRFPEHGVYLQQCSDMRAIMNEEQAQIYDLVTMMVETGEASGPIFIEGGAGTGKTFLLNAICLYVRGHRCIVLPCATTALAGLLYPGGKTAHSLFQIPVIENSVGVESTNVPSSEKARLLLKASVLIWDEFPMANKAVIESVDMLLQQLCGNNRPFGGKCFIAAGDFRQIALIVQGSGRRATLNASIRSSETWNAFAIHRLHQPIRNAVDIELVRCVAMIGENWSSDTVTLDLFQTTTSIDDAREFLFPAEVLVEPSRCEKRAFLSPLNVYVNDFNNSILDRLGQQGKLYYSYDNIVENDRVVRSGALAESDFLHAYEHPTLPAHVLHLKKGAVCRVMRLLDADKGLVKNARVVIHELYDRYVTVRLLGMQSMSPDYIYPISRSDFFHQPRNAAFTVHRRQLPLKLAYSTTFHSCLGLTLDKIVLDLRTHVFAHGQLYTALTRIRRREDVLILHNDTSPIVTTRNVVYKELLL